jgi:ariadne-1
MKPADKGSAEEAKAELNRYLHYYQRYHNHDQSKRFAEKQKIQTEKRMATLHAQSGGDAAWIDFQFMASATQQVLEVDWHTHQRTRRADGKRDRLTLCARRRRRRLCVLCSPLVVCVQCRNVLKYTYVFAYYLDDGPEKTLFEFLQQQLEASNEHLSELSELPPLEKIDRAQVVNYTRITSQFMNNLLNGVASGLTPH